MRRRYCDYETGSRVRSNWYILFFIIIAIFFFNYFGKRLTQKNVKPAYNFSFKLPSDKVVNLYDIKSDFVVLVFFIMDSENCKRQLLELEKYARIKPDDVELIAVSLGSFSDEWSGQKFKSIRMGYMDPKDARHIVELYNIDFLPTVLILDKFKRVRRRYERVVGYKELRDTIKVLKRFGV